MHLHVYSILSGQDRVSRTHTAARTTLNMTMLGRHTVCEREGKKGAGHELETRAQQQRNSDADDGWNNEAVSSENGHLS